MKKVGFSLPRTVWNGIRRFWPDWNGYEWRKSVLARLEWLGMEEVSFGPTGLACNKGNRFWPDSNGLEWRKSVLVLLTWLGMAELLGPLPLSYCFFAFLDRYLEATSIA
jgi:hypothetical protein